MATYKEFRAQSQRRRRKRGFMRFLAVLIVILLILALAWLATRIAAILYPQSKPGKDFTPVNTLEEYLGSSSTDTSAQGVKVNTDAGPHKEDVDEAALTTPDSRMIALPENGRVDMSYFDDALFLGDSITTGIPMYNDNTFPNSAVAAWKGVSPMTLLQQTVTAPDGSQVNAVDYVVSLAPGKIYILLGSNALTWQADDLIIKYYQELVDAFISRLPGTLLYVQSIPTLTASGEAGYNAKGQNLSRERINALNDQLAKMCYVRGIYYVNLQEALCGNDGYLLDEYDAGDGLHLDPAGYRAWREYLITHTAHRWNNPYLAGSPYYNPASGTSASWLTAAAPEASSDAASSTAAG